MFHTGITQLIQIICDIFEGKKSWSPEQPKTQPQITVQRISHGKHSNTCLNWAYVGDTIQPQMHELKWDQDAGKGIDSCLCQRFSSNA